MADDLDTIALRVHQIAATAAVLAEAARLPDPDGEALSHALYLLSDCLAGLEARIEGMRQGAGPSGGARQRKASGEKAERSGHGRPPEVGGRPPT